MKIQAVLISTLLSFFYGSLLAQKTIGFNGYLTEMPSITWGKTNEGNFSLVDNLVHNRLNFGYTPNSKFAFAAEVRNRFIAGETMKSFPDYANSIEIDYGFMNLSYNLASSDSYVLNVMMDRLWAEYILGSFQVRVGRQRINWAQTMVWNPNDIFNAYSYFDFDYVEKPGIDGVRAQYYTGTASMAEGVVKIDHQNRITMAGRYQFNVGGYDYQLLGGWFNDEEVVVGAGWSGNIAGAGFYGEGSWFIPDSASRNQCLIASIGNNYTFRNSIFLQAEILYSSNLKDGADFLDFYYGQGNVKNLSITDWTWFTSVSYPFSPLLNASFSLMGFPAVKSYYFGPSIDYSLTDNLYLSLIAQYFDGESQGESAKSVYGFFRMKWNF